MARFGRSWTACLTAAIAAGGTFPAAVAAPPTTEATAPAVTIHPGPSSGAPSHVAASPQAVPSKSDVPVIVPNRSPAAYVRSAAAEPMSPPSHEFVRPVETGWIAVAGAFQRQGSYELTDETMTVSEVIELCGGLTPDANGRLRLVRHGKPSGQLEKADDTLVAGDLLIAERVNDVSPAGRPDRELGIVGLTERPLVVRVPASSATVDGMLSLTGQTHLDRDDIVVLAGGHHEVRGDQVASLADGSVLVFDPQTVNSDAVATHPPRTNYFSAADDGSDQAEAPNQAESPARVASNSVPPAPGMGTTTPFLAEPAAGRATVSDRTPQYPREAGPAMEPQPMAGAQLAMAPPAANVSPPALDDDLTQVPPIEMLAPPESEPRYGTRTADRSGSISIGPPDAESHIVPVPSDAFYPPLESPSAIAAPPVAPSRGIASPITAAPATPFDAPVTVQPIDLSDADETVEDDGLSFGDLLPTLLLGGALGGLTFVTLRWLRSRGAAGSLKVRLRLPKRPSRAAVADTDGPLPATIPLSAALPVERPATMDRRELLDAMIADRLPLREEPVTLPLSQHLHGRSPAMKKRRLDGPVTVIIPEPHLTAIAEAHAETVAVRPRVEDRTTDAPPDSVAGVSSRGKRRFDPPPVDPPLTTGTPFERALAARHAAKRRPHDS